MKQVYQRVILIDDEPIQIKVHTKLIQLYLGKQSVEIVGFTDPVQALLYLEDESSNPISTLILLDLKMPHMNGWEFLDHLSGMDTSRVTIYIVSSSVAEADVERANQHPKVAGYTKKPLSSAINGMLVYTLKALSDNNGKT